MKEMIFECEDDFLSIAMLSKDGIFTEVARVKVYEPLPKNTGFYRFPAIIKIGDSFFQKMANPKPTGTCIGGTKHQWKDGWICDKCGLKKANLEPFPDLDSSCGE